MRKLRPKNRQSPLGSDSFHSVLREVCRKERPHAAGESRRRSATIAPRHVGAGRRNARGSIAARRFHGISRTDGPAWRHATPLARREAERRSADWPAEPKAMAIPRSSNWKKRRRAAISTSRTTALTGRRRSLVRRAVRSAAHLFLNGRSSSPISGRNPPFDLAMRPVLD